MALGRKRKVREGGGDSSAGTATFEDVEGVTVSLGVIFALMLAAALVLQSSSTDEGSHERNFLLLLCTRGDFRRFVVEVMEHNRTGDVGVYQEERFSFVLPRGGGRQLDMRQVLLSESYWPEGSGPEAIYGCSNEEAVATAHVILEHFPLRRMDAWALSNQDVALWSDHLNALSSFAMAIFKAGLLGSLLLYISLELSYGREEGPKVIKAWNSVGLWFILANFLCMLGGIFVLMFSQDAYVESQDVFFLRSGRFGGYSKISLLAIFLPLVLLLAAGSAWALIRSRRSARWEDEAMRSGTPIEAKLTRVMPAPTAPAEGDEGC
mmetsp:Transcript_103483/g.267649  ORF Transcript_103483/g.267649 Transcript_103483/m.267649 type:complete len:322 (-) Transcript_103483:171-1136(-)